MFTLPLDPEMRPKRGSVIVTIDPTGTAFRTRMLFGMHFLGGGLAGAVIGTLLASASTWAMRSLA